MIKIRRPKSIPTILTTKGPSSLSTINSLLQTSPITYSQGRGKLPFDRSIYGHESVKKSLMRAQHSKCCFCESKIDHISYGDVEHFRPKAGWKQSAKDRLTKPGYYWLTYDWANLLFCCELCNQRHKRNHFPLIHPLKRAKKPTHTLSKEKPEFINPSDDNPMILIGFRGDTPYAIGGNSRGKTTITTLGLNREPLRERRSELLNLLKLVHKISTGIIPANAKERKDAKALLKKHSSSKSEYSGAVRHNIKSGFSYL